MTTGFFFDERCFWHSGGNYAFMLPVGGLVQPTATGGLPENPETKRRLVNMLLAALSAGLVRDALFATLDGTCQNAYALSRPPGHHCLPDWQNGFCLLANIAIAIQSARAAGKAERVAVLDWDVHHGNGTEAIFYNDPHVLTVSIHQEHNYPLDKGEFADRGDGAGHGANLNIPLPPGTGHTGYLQALDRLALPAIRAFNPDVLIIACGFDAAAFDPLSRMLASVDTFRQMTRQVRPVLRPRGFAGNVRQPD